MHPKILIAMPTYNGQEHALKALIESIKQFTYPNFDILFMDNSEGEEYAEKIRSLGYEVIRDSPENKERFERIISSRNKCREIFLERKYDYLFFLDTDVIAQKDILEKLLAHQKAIVSGIYLGGVEIQGKRITMPVVYIFHDNEKKLVRQLNKNEVIGEDFIEAAATGLGCTLIKREVLEKISFRKPDTEIGTEDAPFYQDARKNGYSCWIDFSLKCDHIPFPEGDVRNEVYKFTPPQGFSYGYSVEYR